MGKSIFALVAAGLALGIFFFYTKSMYDSTQQIQADITQYDQALGKASQLLQKKQQLMTRFNSFKSTDMDRLQKMLPDHFDNVALILDFDSLASRFGMGLENVDVSKTEDTKGSSIGDATDDKSQSLSMKFSTRGTYADFRKFLAGLQQSLRVVDLTSLTLSPDSDGTKTGEPTYRYDLVMRTYWLK